MSINIKRGASKPVQTSPSKTGGASKGGKSAPKANTNKVDSDSVELTNTASTLQQIEQSLADIPIVDNARVDAVSQSIEDGQYTVDNEKVADRIIKSEGAIQKIEKNRKK